MMTDSNMTSNVRKKVDIRLLPILCWLSIVTSLNIMGVGNARLLGLPQDLHMHKQDFNVVVMVFYIPTVLFSVPANLAIQGFRRPAWFLGGMAVLCGIITIGQGVSQSFGGLVACRFLLGLFQTGLQAGSIFFLAAFYSRQALHKRISALLASRLLSNAFGGLIAYAVAHMDDIASLKAWRWLFCLEGILTCLSGVLTICVLPAWPQNVKFLESKEKQTLLSELEEDSRDDASTSISWSLLLRKVLREPKLYFATILQFCSTSISSSSVVFLPTIFSSFKNWTRLQALYMIIPVFLTALLLTILNGAASDYFKLRYPFYAAPICFVIAAYGILLSSTSQVSVVVRYVACFLLISGAFASHSTALVWLSNNFIGRRRRGFALGIVASLGNCGFLLGSNVFLEREAQIGYRTGFGVGLGLSLLGLVVASLQLGYFVCDNRRRVRGMEEVVVDGSKNMY